MGRERRTARTAYLAEIMSHCEGRVGWENNVCFNDKGFSRVVDGEMLDANDERGEASEKVGDALRSS